MEPVDVTDIVNDLIGKKDEIKKEEEVKSSVPVIESKRVSLSMQQKVGEFSVFPRTIPTYTKGIQVDNDNVEYDDDDIPSLTKKNDEENIIIPKSYKDNERNEKNEKSEEPEIEHVQELSEEEKERLLQSKELAKFLEDATRVAERALFISNKFDLLVDYSEKKGAEREGIRDGEISLATKLISDRWTKNRCVTSIDWSPKVNSFVELSLQNNILILICNCSLN